MGKRIAGTLLTCGATALAIALGATAVAATTTTLTVTVSGGGSFTGSAPTTTLKNGNVTVTCSSKGSTPASSASGSVPNGTHKGTAPVNVGATVSKLKFNNCTGPLGPVTAAPAKEPYKLEVDSATNGSGDTSGIVTGIDVNVSMTDCTFTVTGEAPGYLNNSKHTLNMTPNPPVKPLTKAQITVKNVNGCLGVVKNGDHPTYTATYTLKPATVTVKSTG